MVVDDTDVDGVIELLEIVDVVVELESEKESTFSESEVFGVDGDGGVESWRGTFIACGGW